MKLVEIVRAERTSQSVIQTALEVAKRMGKEAIVVRDTPGFATSRLGLDVRFSIAETLYRELGESAFRPPELLRRKVEEGKLGKKTGEGFYRWPRE